MPGRKPCWPRGCRNLTRAEGDGAVITMAGDLEVDLLRPRWEVVGKFGPPRRTRLLQEEESTCRLWGRCYDVKLGGIWGSAEGTRSLLKYSNTVFFEALKKYSEGIQKFIEDFL